MHAELLSAYNRAKTVRRHLRARLGTKDTVNPTTKITERDYVEQMKVLSDVQLTFEVYAKRAKDRRLWFWGAKTLASSLKEIEGYLNDIVDEYEKNLTGFAGNPPAQELSHLKNLTEFIGPHDQATKFQKRFQGPIDDALKALGNAILR
jgi:hypothetical protein